MISFGVGGMLGILNWFLEISSVRNQALLYVHPKSYMAAALHTDVN